MRDLATARIILAATCGTYLLSAALLAYNRAPAWVSAGWLVTGVAGLALLPWLGRDRPIVQLLVLLVLAPWMAYAAFGDGRGGRWVMVAVDVAGLAAIGFGLLLARRG